MFHYTPSATIYSHFIIPTLHSKNSIVLTKGFSECKMGMIDRTLGTTFMHKTVAFRFFASTDDPILHYTVECGQYKMISCRIIPLEYF